LELYKRSSHCDEVRPHEIHNLDEQHAYTTSVYQIPYERLPPRYTPKTTFPEAIFGKATFDKHFQELGNNVRRSQIVNWWYHQINDYADRQLTFHHDRFPAFSGIAKIYSGLTQYEYKAGIMVEDFRRGLLWQSGGRAIHAEVAPCWSWAVVHEERTCHRIYELIYAHDEYVDDASEVELIDISVKNLSDSCFGQVVSGSLTLRGLCQRLSGLLKASNFYFQSGWHSDHWSSRDQNYQPFTEYYPSPLEAMRIHMDVMDESNIMFWRREDIYIMRISTFSSYPDISTGRATLR
jgi:hypothetical protein